MRKGIGITLILLGVVCLLFAAGMVVHHHLDAKVAKTSAESILQEAQEMIKQSVIPTIEKEDYQEIPSEDVSEESPKKIPVVRLQEDNCIGILSIPVLELELPVLDRWNYSKLKKAPCRYFGSCYGTDFVIAAHNYAAHFGRLSELKPGDLVIFTDATGGVYGYEVILLETLPGTATEAMITSGFDLSLYTCTPGGANRVTVRCNRIQENVK